MSLKDNKWTLTKETKLHIQNGDKKVVYCEEYVKEAVKEYATIINQPFGLAKSTEERFNQLINLRNKFEEIFGDFEK